MSITEEVRIFRENQECKASSNFKSNFFIYWLLQCRLGNNKEVILILCSTLEIFWRTSPSKPNHQSDTTVHQRRETRAVRARRHGLNRRGGHSASQGVSSPAIVKGYTSKQKNFYRQKPYLDVIICVINISLINRRWIFHEWKIQISTSSALWNYFWIFSYT